MKSDVAIMYDMHNVIANLGERLDAATRQLETQILQIGDMGLTIAQLKDEKRRLEEKVLNLTGVNKHNK